MAYISSIANRWYCALESAYGQLPAITAANRVPAIKLTAQQQRANSKRKDKTGSRTWPGIPDGVRRQTQFGLSTLMIDWPDTTALPPQDPLFQAAFGGAGTLWAGAPADAGTDPSNIKFATAPGLAPGQAVTFNGEIRFVSAVSDDQLTVVLNAPFSTAPVPADPIGPTVGYSLTSELPSVSLFDYWDPSSAVQRVISGLAVDRFTINLNGDFHGFDFKGAAQDIVDSSSFVSGQGGATAFPAEPAAAEFDYSPVPGNLGQVWLGVVPSQFFTVAQASIEIRNNINMRLNEFGSVLPRGIAPGTREVTVTLELFSQDDAATAALYQAARQHSAISMMFQLGQLNGQLMGVFLKSLIPDVPVFDDSDSRLKWKFSDTRAQGTIDDEVVVAFG
ncbi:MAG TPA: hypothetical protein VG297_19925 [Bryobacteraceae bacterium]|nr:hypothetical protein [Bryobacteraceae bacterium]